MGIITTYDTQAARSGAPDGTLLADGFEEALIGYGYRFNYPVAVYSKAECMDILMFDGIMNYEEATEYFDFNVIGAYAGESTPVFLNDEFDLNELEQGESQWTEN